MIDKKEDSESGGVQIDGNVGDYANNIAIGQNILQISINMPDGSSKLISKDDLSSEEQELLKASYADGLGDGLIEVSTEQEPFLFIQAGRRRFAHIKYRLALKKLCEHKLATLDPLQEQKHDKHYSLTSPGEELAHGL